MRTALDASAACCRGPYSRLRFTFFAPRLTSSRILEAFRYFNIRDIFTCSVAKSWNNSGKKITQLPVCEHTNADSSVHWSGHTV